MNKILIGSSNPAKIESYKKLLKGFNLELVSAKDLKIPAPVEKGNSFEDEAINKARYYYQKSGIPTLVDDGGMQIEALNGEPGTKSHRWVGREMKDEEIISEVMKRMKNVPKDGRACKFTVVLACATPFGVFTADGDLAGVIADKPAGKIIQDFPYRSVTYLPNYNKYWCDITHEEEEILDHRKVALEKIKDIIKEISK